MSLFKIVVIASDAGSVVDFRGSLLAALAGAGHDVLTCSPDGGAETTACIQRLGVTYRPIYLKPTGMNPVSDLKAIYGLVRFLRDVRPDIVLAYTIKPVIYGSFAARIARVPKTFSMITGLGYTFDTSSIKQRLLNHVVRFLYRAALSGNHAVFFQNQDDLAMFAENAIVRKRNTVLINGSGVDLRQFKMTPVPKERLCFLLIARLIKGKGIAEFVAGARILKRRYPAAVFQILGPLDSQPGAYREADVSNWRREGVVEYLGATDHALGVRPYLAGASVYVLPSYREGTPRSVLEAMAMGRPIITTDAPGCRETVIHGKNGFLVPVRDVAALVDAMERFVLEPALMDKMGKRSRRIAEEKYDARRVNAVIMRAMGLSGVTSEDLLTQSGLASSRPTSA